MFIKKKHILVIILSSIIITAVFVSTLIGYTLYIQWKKDSFELKYRNSIYKLTAELFRKDVFISNVNVKILNNMARPDVPVFEGTLKNNSNKIITSILLEVSFQGQDGTVAYKAWFHPLGEQYPGDFTLSPVKRQTRNILFPGKGLSFRHPLRNCPREIVTEVTAKSNFAKNDSKRSIKLVYSIEGLSVL
ncbi:MAG: hypothetical protein U9R44_01880 [Candidatus Omnitrophota bacterium]|nr:hypothetical protein [Candidatus Omnitrophota bacterium]